MPKTYEPIATTTTTGTNSITWSSIPATYTDLIVIAGGYETPNAYFIMRLNGDSGSNYSRTALRGNGSTASSARASNENGWFPDFSTNTSVAICHIMNYSNSTTYKTMLGRFNNSDNIVVAQVNLWRNTAAVNEVKLLSPTAGNNLIGTFTIYGIKSA